uniref:Conserved plasma membrane protein n=1 Tax=Haemonchus contortus TaxID=6289 RepID=A0A7I4Z4H1_HAECO
EVAVKRDSFIFMDRDEYYTRTPNNNVTYTVTKTEVIEVEPVDCNPVMLSHPMALLRWFQLAMYFLLQWLVQITCGNDACTMIMNVFGYTAMGQLFVLLILLLMSIICVLILIAYGLNIHRTTYANAILGVERLYAALGIILFIIAGILGTWMAVLANQEDVNYQGRGKFHIKGQWIAAAVFEFLMALLFIGDFLLQRRENYPFTGKQYKKRTVQAASRPQYEIYTAPPITTTKTTTNEEYITQPQQDLFNQQSRI